MKELVPPVHPRAYLTLTCIKMFKSDDQMIKSQSHSHSHSHEDDNQIIWSNLDQITLSLSLSISKYLDLIFSFSPRRYVCLLFSFTLPWYVILLFTFTQPRYACVELCCCCCYRCYAMMLLQWSYNEGLLFFYRLSWLPKSSQKPPKSLKAAFLKKHALLPSLVCMCFSHL